MTEQWVGLDKNIHIDKDHGAQLDVNVVGEEPTSFFVEGTHPDEDLIRNTLDRILKTRADTKPDLYRAQATVLQANTPGVAVRTRKVYGVDLNREFLPSGIVYPQAQALAEAVTIFPKLRTGFSIHIDLATPDFYMYHTTTGNEQLGDPVIHGLKRKLMRDVQAAGVGLYTGEDDPTLGYQVIDGFVESAVDEPIDSTFESWMVRQRKKGFLGPDRVFLFEIPGMQPLEKSQEILELVFNDFIDGYLLQINSTIPAK